MGAGGLREQSDWASDRVSGQKARDVTLSGPYRTRRDGNGGPRPSGRPARCSALSLATASRAGPPRGRGTGPSRRALHRVSLGPFGRPPLFGPFHRVTDGSFQGHFVTLARASAQRRGTHRTGAREQLARRTPGSAPGHRRPLRRQPASGRTAASAGSRRDPTDRRTRLPRCNAVENVPGTSPRSRRGPRKAIHPLRNLSRLSVQRGRTPGSSVQSARGTCAR